LLTGHITDANPSRVHFQRRSMITKDNPSQQDNEQHATRYIRNMLLLKTFFFSNCISSVFYIFIII